MSEFETGPVRITDKREEKRLAAAEAARLRAEAAEHPVAQTPVEPSIDRLERIQQLRDAASFRDLTEDEQSELLALQAEESELDDQERGPDVPKYLTAFVVVIGHDGSARALDDPNEPFDVERQATVDDMYSGLMLVKRDIDAAMSAKHTVFGLNVSAQAMQQQARSAQMLQGLQNGGMPTGRRR